MILIRYLKRIVFLAKILNKIIADGVGGALDPANLAMPDLYKLLSIYQRKHNCELSLAGSFSQSFSQRDVIREMCVLHQGSATDEAHLRKSYFVTEHCAFLFSADVILKAEMQAIKNLVDLGFLHFPPIPENMAACRIFYGNSPLPSHGLRAELANCSLLINTPNTLNVDPKIFSRQVEKDSPRYPLHMKAMSACSMDAKEILNTDPLIANLLMISNLHSIFAEIYRYTLHGDPTATRRMHNLIGVLNRTKACNAMSYQEKDQYLEASDVNELLGVLFNIKGMDRMQRLNLLHLLCLSNTKADLIITQLEQMGALNEPE